MPIFDKAKNVVTIVGLVLSAYFSPTGDGQVKNIGRHLVNDRRERLRDANRQANLRKLTPGIEQGNKGPSKKKEKQRSRGR